MVALSALAFPALSRKIKFFTGLKSTAHRRSEVPCCSNFGTSTICSMQVATIEPFGEPRNPKMHVDNFWEKLWEAFPEPVKEFPWKKANKTILERLLFVGEQALKWSLITIFIVGSLSDVVLAISRNREVMIPLGLLVGCMMADFLKETSLELFQNTKERSLSRLLLAIGIFFVLVKVFSVYVTGRFFLSYVGNGGLMQVLWLWKKSQEEEERNRNESSFLSQEALVNSNAED